MASDSDSRLLAASAVGVTVVVLRFAGLRLRGLLLLLMLCVSIADVDLRRRTERFKENPEQPTLEFQYTASVNDRGAEGNSFA